MPSLIEKVIRKSVARGVTALSEFNRGRMGDTDTPHPFLTGLNAPMDREFTLTDLVVEGQIPAALDGRYVRIGPNPITLPANPAGHHWFVGDGMTHGVRLKDGQALWYRNRWIRSNPVAQALGEAPAPGPHGPRDTVNTNVIGHAGKLWALVEAGSFPVELDGDLNSVAYNPFEGTLKGSFSAHGHLDVATGDLHAICYEATDQNTIRHVVVGAEGRVKREEPIAVRHGPSVHDCMVTEHYVIVLDLPVTFSMPTLVAGYAFPYKWNPEHRARVGVLAKNAPGSEVVWCDVEPCYVFHPCNGYETPEGQIILDVVAHATMFEDSLIGPTAKASAFERWTIDPAVRQVQRQVVHAQAQEFPRPDERRMGRPYRYAYTSSLMRDKTGEFVSGPQLYKHDMHTGACEVHDFGPNRHAGEFVFQPRHADAAEDEGWLMGYVVDSEADTTDFVILNADDFSGVPQAVVKLPHRVPPGFHGNWVPDSAA